MKCSSEVIVADVLFLSIQAHPAHRNLGRRDDGEDGADRSPDGDDPVTVFVTTGRVIWGPAIGLACQGPPVYDDE
jgi:hypothetical protein